MARTRSLRNFFGFTAGSTLFVMLSVASPWKEFRDMSTSYPTEEKFFLVMHGCGLAIILLMYHFGYLLKGLVVWLGKFLRLNPKDQFVSVLVVLGTGALVVLGQRHETILIPTYCVMGSIVSVIHMNWDTDLTVITVSFALFMGGHVILDFLNKVNRIQVAVGSIIFVLLMFAVKLLDTLTNCKCRCRNCNCNGNRNGNRGNRNGNRGNAGNGNGNAGNGNGNRGNAGNGNGNAGNGNGNAGNGNGNAVNDNRNPHNRNDNANVGLDVEAQATRDLQMNIAGNLVPMF